MRSGLKWPKLKEAWNFGFLAASPKSLFISFFDYVAKRDEPSMGIKVLEHKERGFNPSILTSDLLSTYRAIAGYFGGCLHGFSRNHARCIIEKNHKRSSLEGKEGQVLL